MWCSLPSYPGFSLFHQSYTQITQWQGKELRNAVRIVCSTLAVALSQPTPAERAPFAQVQWCIFALVNFIFLAQYHSHDDETISLMESYWQEFHKEMNIFLEFWPTNHARKKADKYEWNELQKAESVPDKGVQ